MKDLLTLIPEFLVSAVGWMLLHALWQGALLALVAALGFYLLRNRPAQARYGLGIGLLVAQVAGALATLVYYLQDVKDTATAAGSTSIATTGAASALLWRPVELTLASQARLWIDTHLTELVVCWLIGAGLLMLRFIGSWLYVEYLRSGAVPVADRDWRNRFSILTARLNITQSIELCESARITTPMVVGALSPVVLLPIGLLTGFATAQVEAILAHELAHIRRHDYLVNLLQSFVEVVFFFHPALWWLSNKVRTEREHCCDDIAITISGDRVSLAHALVRVAEWQSSPGLAVPFASQKPVLLQRVRRVLGLAPKPVRMWAGLPVLLVVAGVLVGVSVYAVGRKQDKKMVKATTAKVKDIPYLPVAYADTTIEVDVEDTEDIDINIDNEEIADIPDMDFRFEYDWKWSENDTLREKLEAFHRKMEGLQQQMEPLHRRIEDLHLTMEKYRFEQERYDREWEKIEWKKDKLMEAREKLIQKRSALLHPNQKAGGTKLSEAEVEKQLADIEQQIKAQEQEVAQLNAQIAEGRRQAETAGEPFRKTQQEIEQISRQLETIGRKMELEARGMEKYMPTPPPPPAPDAPRAPRPAKAAVKPGAALKGSVAPPVPAPPARPAAPPVPPTPPAPKD